MRREFGKKEKSFRNEWHRHEKKREPKLIFLDRDGVINKDPGGWTEFDYVTNKKDFHFLPGSLDALRLLKKGNIQVIIISNQAGVGKGNFTRAELDAVTRWMCEEVKRHGGEITDVFYCVHKKEDNCS